MWASPTGYELIANLFDAVDDRAAGCCCDDLDLVPIYHDESSVCFARRSPARMVG